MLNLSLKQLRLFVAIAQQGTLTQAAESLFMSKPAVSIALAELEKQLNTQLFNRHKGRLIINAIGKQVLPLAIELLKRSEMIATVASNCPPGRLSIGASYTIGNYLAPFLIKDFQQTHPDSKHMLQILNTQNIADKLRQYQLDIGLVEGLIHDTALRHEKWFCDHMVVICSSEHPLSTLKTKIDFDLLNEQYWIVRESGSGTRHYFDTYLATNLDRFEIAYELTSPSAIISAVTAGLGMACIPKIALQHTTSIDKISMLNLTLPPRQYWLVYHQNQQPYHLTPFLDHCRQWAITFNT